MDDGSKSWYLAKGKLKTSTMRKIWNDLENNRDSSTETFTFGSGERCCLFVEFQTPDVDLELCDALPVLVGVQYIYHV
jgi:hypothetical protein